jgi:hypothetical protein
MWDWAQVDAGFVHSSSFVLLKCGDLLFEIVKKGLFENVSKEVLRLVVYYKTVLRDLNRRSSRFWRTRLELEPRAPRRER